MYEKINVLLLGSGGRESAIAWKLGKSKLLNKLFIAPGNAGTSLMGENIELSVNDFAGIGHFVLENKINLVIPGPEEPLVNGIHDFFQDHSELKKIPVIGPKKAGARLEGSKDFAKEFMRRNNIPTAEYQSFTSDTIDNGIEYLRKMRPPYVLKADGLAAGKGVVICQSINDAEAELKEMLGRRKFGVASDKVVIEQFLSGTELSVFILTDGDNYVILPEAKDYKRIGEKDTGPNTGGMGSVSPVPFANNLFMQKVEEQIVIPTVEGLKKESIEYCGFIFFGLINVNGNPFVIEYNVRMGDPETESVMPRLKNDLLELFIATSKGELSNYRIESEINPAVTVMLVSGGYPGEYSKDKAITQAKLSEDVLVFHAGTKLSDNEVVTNGGRVIAVTTLADSLSKAIDQSMHAAAKIEFEGAYFRRDIGMDLL